MKAMLILPVLFAFFAACSKEITTVSPDPPSVNRTLLLQLVNDARKKGCKCGDVYYAPAAPLTWDSKLEQAAASHSQDMFTAKYFSHTANDGSNAGERISRTGYNWKFYGENIANGYRTEQEVVDGWIQSPGHCKNIMNKDFKEMGVGRQGLIWTQVFAAR